MCWYSHPDTILMARAREIAARAGHPPTSVGALLAYRNAYATVAADCWPDSLATYLAAIDNEIEALRARGGAADVMSALELPGAKECNTYNPFLVGSPDDMARCVQAIGAAQHQGFWGRVVAKLRR